MTATETATRPTFTPGQIVTCRSACDHNTIWTFEIIGRSAKFITIQDVSNADRPETPVRVGVKTGNDGEWAMPMGTFSMAPVIRAAS
jgi:hypothetical protein